MPIGAIPSPPRGDTRCTLPTAPSSGRSSRPRVPPPSAPACWPARARRPRRPPERPAATAGSKVVGYFTEWGTLRPQVLRQEHRDLGIRGQADPHQLRLRQRHRRQVRHGRLLRGHRPGDTAAESVDGIADTWDQPLRGNFNQLLKLKKKHPGLKVLWSFGGWTWSSGFGEAAKNPAAFAQSCYDLVKNSKWAGVFDGIDIDWEYPNACGQHLRHQRAGGVQEPDGRPAREVRLLEPGHRGDHRGRHQRRQDRRPRTTRAPPRTSTGTTR